MPFTVTVHVDLPPRSMGAGGRNHAEDATLPTHAVITGLLPSHSVGHLVACVQGALGLAPLRSTDGREEWPVVRLRRQVHPAPLTSSSWQRVSVENAATIADEARWEYFSDGAMPLQRAGIGDGAALVAVSAPPSSASSSSFAHNDDGRPAEALMSSWSPHSRSYFTPGAHRGTESTAVQVHRRRNPMSPKHCDDEFDPEAEQQASSYRLVVNEGRRMGDERRVATPSRSTYFSTASPRGDVTSRASARTLHRSATTPDFRGSPPRSTMIASRRAHHPHHPDDVNDSAAWWTRSAADLLAAEHGGDAELLKRFSPQWPIPAPSTSAAQSGSGDETARGGFRHTTAAADGFAVHHRFEERHGRDSTEPFVLTDGTVLNLETADEWRLAREIDELRRGTDRDPYDGHDGHDARYSGGRESHLASASASRSSLPRAANRALSRPTHLDRLYD